MIVLSLPCIVKRRLTGASRRIRARQTTLRRALCSGVESSLTVLAHAEEIVCQPDHFPYMAGANKGSMKNVAVKFQSTVTKSGGQIMMTDKSENYIMT